MPAAANAQLNELPFEPVPDGATATCLRATGVPGGLAQLGPLSRRTSATDLLTVADDGSALAARVRLGALVDCAAVAQAGNGSAVVAGAVSHGRRVEVRAATRDPDGVFGADVRLGRAGLGRPGVAAAISPSGHAVVAWAQYRGMVEAVRGDLDAELRIVAARRAPGARFGPTEPLTSWRRVSVFAEVKITAGIDAAGTATLAWLRPRPDTRRFSGIADVQAATAPPAGRFAVQRLPAQTQDAPTLALAVAANGRALLTVDAIPGVAVFERGTAGGPLAPVRLAVGRRRPDDEPSAPVVALREDGGAVVAWRVGFDEDAAGVVAATRVAAGPFGPVRRVAPAGSSGSFAFGESVVLSGEAPLPPSDTGNNRLRVALAADGRAVLAWTVGPPLEPRFAAGSLAGGFGAPKPLGSPIRDANGLAPLFLADGRAALAWTDNEPSSFPFGGHGRLHVAVDGAAPPRPSPPPRLTVYAERTQRLFRSEPLRLAVACDRACDLRASLAGGDADVATATRTAAGRSRLRLALGPRPARHRTRPVRVVVRAAAPGARRVVSAAVRVRIVRRPRLPIPRPIAVRARRRGAAIVVTWRTAFPARRADFVVVGRRTRRSGRRIVGVRDAYALRRGRGRTRFAVRLRSRRPDAVRWVIVAAVGRDGGKGRKTVVRVR